MSLSAPLDAMFVPSKTREHPMHVDGFHVFPAARRRWPDSVQTLHRRKPAWPPAVFGCAEKIGADMVAIVKSQHR